MMRNRKAKKTKNRQYIIDQHISNPLIYINIICAINIEDFANKSR
jgi:hypothetical protein